MNRAQILTLNGFTLALSMWITPLLGPPNHNIRNRKTCFTINVTVLPENSPNFKSHKYPEIHIWDNVLQDSSNNPRTLEYLDHELQVIQEELKIKTADFLSNYMINKETYLPSRLKVAFDVHMLNNANIKHISCSEIPIKESENLWNLLDQVYNKKIKPKLKKHLIDKVPVDHLDNLDTDTTLPDTYWIDDEAQIDLTVRVFVTNFILDQNS